MFRAPNGLTKAAAKTITGMMGPHEIYAELGFTNGALVLEKAPAAQIEYLVVKNHLHSKAIEAVMDIPLHDALSAAWAKNERPTFETFMAWRFYLEGNQGTQWTPNELAVFGNLNFYSKRGDNITWTQRKPPARNVLPLNHNFERIKTRLGQVRTAVLDTELELEKFGFFGMPGVIRVDWIHEACVVVDLRGDVEFSTLQDGGWMSALNEVKQWFIICVLDEIQEGSKEAHLLTILTPTMKQVVDVKNSKKMLQVVVGGRSA